MDIFDQILDVPTTVVQPKQDIFDIVRLEQVEPELEPKKFTPIERLAEIGKSIARMPQRMFGQVGNLMEWAADYTPEKSWLPPERVAGVLWDKIQPQWHSTLEEANRMTLRRYGEKTSSYWKKAAETGWEAASEEYLQQTWKTAPLTKAFTGAFESSGSFLAAIATGYITKSPQLGILLLSGLSGGSAYKLQKEKGTDQEVAQNMALFTAAFEGLTEQIPFNVIFNQKSKTLLRKFLKSGATEGLQEFIQGMGENFFEYFGYDFKKDWKSVPHAVRQGVAHLLDNWLDNITAGFIMGGMAGGGIQALQQRNISEKLRDKDIPPVAPEAAAPPTERPVKPAPAEEGLLRKAYIKGFVARIQSIKNNADNVIAKAGDRTEQLKIMGEEISSLQKSYAEISETIEKSPDVFAELLDIKKILPDYAGVINSFREKPSQKKFQQITKLSNQITELQQKYGARLGEQIPVVERPVEKRIYKGPAYRAETGYKPTGTAADVVRHEQEVLGNDLGITDEQLVELEKRPASDVVWVTRTEEEAKRYGKPEEIKVQGGEILADIGPDGVLVSKSVIPVVERPAEKRVKEITKKKALALGHKYPKILGMDEGARREFMEAAVGKRSMKDMSLEEKRFVVEALEDEMDRRGIDLKTGEQYIKEYDEAVNVIKGLPAVKKKHKIYTKRMARTGIWTVLKDVTIGANNLNVGALGKILAGGKENIISNVFGRNRNRAVARIDKHYHGAVKILKEGLEKAGITGKDLAKISSSQDARAEIIKFSRELLEIPKTDYKIVEINNKKFKLSYGNLIHIYLMAQQEGGMRHLKYSGLDIFKQKTGPLSDKQIGLLTSMVLDNPKVKAIADSMTDVAINHDAVALNAVSNRMGEKDLATETNYFHLEIGTPRKMRGKYLRQMSLLENKGLFRERKKTGAGALVVRDALDVFVATQQAVSEYVGMAEQLREMHTLLNYKPFVGTIEKQGYGKIRNNMITLLERAQSNPQVSGDVSRLLSRILHGAYRAVLFLNPRVFVSQYTSTIQYMALVNPKYYKHIGHGGTPTQIKEMLDHSDVAWRRFYMGYQSVELARLGQLDETLRFFTGKAADINKAGIFIKTTDTLALHDGWKIAKNIVEDTTTLEKGSEAYWLAISETAEDLWQQSQPSWDKWNRSINTSDPTPFKQTFLLFRSYYEKALSMINVAQAEYSNSNKTVRDKAKLSKVYGAVMGSQMINAVLRGLVSWGLWRDRKTIWDFIADMVAAPFAMIAIFGKAFQISIGNFFKTLGKRRVAYIKEPISSLPISIINIMLQAPDEFGKAAAEYINGNPEKGKKHLIRSITHVYRSFGLICGVPVYELERAKKGWFKKKKIKFERKR